MPYTLTITNWQTDKKSLSKIRKTVFIEEQNVPETLEWDEFDSSSIHILVTDSTHQAIATARMQSNGHIGRMAVLKEFRNTGIGSTILKELIKIAANKKLKSIFLDAQINAIPFYEKLGFAICSDEFLDANIPHKNMIKYLNNK